MKMVVNTVSVRMMLFVRCPSAEKCICTADSADDSSRRTWVSTRSTCSSTSRERTRSSSRSRMASGVAVVGPVAQGVDPFLHAASLVLADVLQPVQQVAAFQQRPSHRTGCAGRAGRAAAWWSWRASTGGAAPGSCPPCG